MVFVGLGFLTVYVKGYSLTAVSYNFIMGAWAIQLSLLMIPALWEAADVNYSGDYKIALVWVGDYCAAGVMIMLGCMVGKVTFIECFLLTTVFCLCWALNLMLIDLVSDEVNDAGFTMRTVLFAAISGTATRLVWKKPHDDQVEIKLKEKDY